MNATGSPTPSHWVDLRRADWRFLLPHPRDGAYQHLLMLGAPPGLAARLLDAGFARRISQRLPVDMPADAVAILGGAASPATMRGAIGALAPDGVLYCEVSRHSLGSLRMTPAALRSTLAKQALSLSGLYWALPGFAAPKRYVPLDTRGALRWYFETLYVLGRPSQLLADRAVRAVTGYRGSRIARLVPWYAVTATRALSARPSIFGHPDCPEELRPPGLRPFLLTMGIDEGSRVVVMPFADGAGRPDAVLKVARVPEVNDNIVSEQRALDEIRARLDRAIRHSVPESLGLFFYGDLAVGIERAAPGRALTVTSGRWAASDGAKIRDLWSAIDWLSAFHQQVQLGPAEHGASELLRRFEQLFASYAATFGVTPDEERLFAAVRAQTAALSDMPLPIVWHHGDFAPWNIVRDGRQVTVIDWEVRHGPLQEQAGPALAELIYFVTYWSFVARRWFDEAAERRGVREIFLECDRSDPIVDAIHQTIDAYAARLGIDRRFVPLLLVYTWVKRALEGVDRDRVLAQPGCSVRETNQFVDWIGMFAEETDRLFPPAGLMTHALSTPGEGW